MSDYKRMTKQQEKELERRKENTKLGKALGQFFFSCCLRRQRRGGKL